MSKPFLSIPMSPLEQVSQCTPAITAPGPYLDIDESLSIEAISAVASVVVRIRGKLLNTNSEVISFFQDLTISAVGSPTPAYVRPGQGWILGFDVRVISGSVGDGQIVASVHVVRNADTVAEPVMCLASGEITTRRALGLGAFFGVGQGGLPGNGQPSVRSVSNPAAGAQWTTTISAGTNWLVLSLHCKLTCSATVASRTVDFTVTSSGNVIGVLAGADGLAASTVTDIMLSQGPISGTRTTTVGTSTQGLFAPMLVPAGATIASRGLNFQAGDQWSEINFLAVVRPL